MSSWIRGGTRSFGIVAALAGSLLLAAPAVAATDGPYRDVYWVNSCTAYSNTAPAFSGTPGGASWTTPDQCASAGNRSLEINAKGSVVRGKSGKWATQTPSTAIKIIGAYTPSPVSGYPNPLADCTLGADGFSASYFWGDNGTNYGTLPITVNCQGGSGLGQAGYINQKFTASRYFGWQAACVKATCSATGGGSLAAAGDVFGVAGISLEAQATNGPALDAVGNNLWYQSGWVRGAWSTDLAATDPAGVCGLQTAANGTAVNTYVDLHPDTSNWSQCPGSQIDSSVDTSNFADGQSKLSLWFWASNAAGATSMTSKVFNVDNKTPSVSLSGPTDVLSTAGQQYVTATATAGPSGVAGMWCSVDGGGFGWHSGASAQVAVAGLGIHAVSCYAQNDAVNASGVPGSSAAGTWQLKIGQPTVAAISFSKVINALQCHHGLKRIKVLGRLHKIRRRGHLLRVRGRAHFKTVKVVSCHPRTVRRRVLVVVTVRRHGKLVRVRRRELRRVVLLPRRVDRATRRVAFGHGSTVSGWLGRTDGTALAGQRVRIMTAANDGLERFGPTAIATTAADGSWTAQLPAGPSRLVEAAYDGTSTTEATTSSRVRVTVPAKVRISIAPRNVRWGGTIRIFGRVLGGYIPHSSKLLRLDIGIQQLHAIQGIPEVSRSGRFSTTYTFNRSSGRVRFYFTVSTLAEADYPYAPGRSRRVAVTVGGAGHR